MKKVTISSTVLAASLCFGTQSAMAAGSLEDKDMLFAFGAESSVNTMMLSEREMVETEGEAWPAVIAWGIRLWSASRPVVTTGAYGGGGGAMTYAVQNAGTSNWNTRDFGVAAGSGFVSATAGRFTGLNRPGTAMVVGGIGGGLVNRFGVSSSNSNYNNNFINVGGSNCYSCYRGGNWNR